MCECHCLRARTGHAHHKGYDIAHGVIHPHATPKPVEFVCAGGGGGGDSAHAWTGPLDGASWAPAWTPFAAGGGAEQPLWEYWLAIPPLGSLTPQTPVGEPGIWGLLILGIVAVGVRKRLGGILRRAVG